MVLVPRKVTRYSGLGYKLAFCFSRGHTHAHTAFQSIPQARRTCIANKVGCPTQVSKTTQLSSSDLPWPILPVVLTFALLLVIWSHYQYKLASKRREHQIAWLRLGPSAHWGTCKPGDIIFSSRETQTSTVTELATRFPFVHAGVVIELDPPIVWDISPQMGRGARWELATYLYGFGNSRAAVLRTKAHVGRLDVGPFEDRQFEGSIGAIALRWASGYRSQRSKQMFCVEMVMAVLCHNFGLFRETNHRQSAGALYRLCCDLEDWYHPELISLPW